mmetsp:Transcript_143099/g.249531  ORF Transcript_143099/g.249531 Transcript_143099/m.249531 type:complete len:207 (-) Transcript_143099:461-1081(-)
MLVSSGCTKMAGCPLKGSWLAHSSGNQGARLEKSVVKYRGIISLCINLGHCSLASASISEKSKSTRPSWLLPALTSSIHSPKVMPEVKYSRLDQSQQSEVRCSLSSRTSPQSSLISSQADSGSSPKSSPSMMTGRLSIANSSKKRLKVKSLACTRGTSVNDTVGASSPRGSPASSRRMASSRSPCLTRLTSGAPLIKLRRSSTSWC